MRATGSFLAGLAAGLLLSVSAAGQNWSVGVNVLDCAELGTMNVEASMGVARRWTVGAGAKYNPFTWEVDGRPVADRQRSFEAGARWWPWHIYSGWWMAGKVRYQEYNVGGISSPASTEGDRYGGGLSAGYSYMLNPHLNLDLGLGLWSGVDRYTVYECVRCGRTVGGGERFFVLPSDIMLSVSYIF